jgi:hypothetical protein
MVETKGASLYILFNIEKSHYGFTLYAYEKENARRRGKRRYWVYRGEPLVSKWLRGRCGAYG